MTKRERALAVLKGVKPDCIPWFGDLDYYLSFLRVSGELDPLYEGIEGEIRFYQDMDTGYYLQGYFPYKKIYNHVSYKKESFSGGKVVRTTIDTPLGTIEGVEEFLMDSFSWAPKEHFIKGADDLKVIRFIYQHMEFESDYDKLYKKQSFFTDNELLVAYTPRSPFMQMVVELAGIENTIYAMLDDPEEFRKTIDVLHEKANEAAAITLSSPAELVMIPENLSSEVVGKEYYHNYMEPYERTWAKKIGAAGKYSLIHMDGTLSGLLREVSQVGFSVLEALTPAPVGDIPFEEFEKWTEGTGSIIWGGIPGAYFDASVSDKQFDEFVKLLLDYILNSNRLYVLGVSDQVPPEIDPSRIARVNELVERYGYY